MGLCKDKSNEFLRDVGYNVIRLPRDFLPPLSLLSKQDDTVEYIGSIDRLIRTPGHPLPTITSDQAAANINGNSTSRFKLDLGLKILNGLISGLGGSTLGVGVNFTNAKSVTFEFNNVTFDSVTALDVGNYLRDSEVDYDNPLIEQYVLGNGKLFVVTERLRSKEITTNFEASKDVGATVDVPVISAAVGGNIGVQTSGGRAHAIKFSGLTPVTFGFKCFRIGVEDGEITMFSVKPGGLPMSVAHVQPDDGALLDDGMVDVVEA